MQCPPKSKRRKQCSAMLTDSIPVRRRASNSRSVNSFNYKGYKPRCVHLSANIPGCTRRRYSGSEKSTAHALAIHTANLLEAETAVLTTPPPQQNTCPWSCPFGPMASTRPIVLRFIADALLSVLGHQEIVNSPFGFRAVTSMADSGSLETAPSVMAKLYTSHSVSNRSTNK